ncbi:cell division protein CpoB [Serratia symbiotica]|uniref:cell division protein CpoB n=1 Tax=Serratia symbiotica TaxID=138074 RepID=UPI0030D57D7E|nr:cell division protein CpoB [Serratia symbiotica]
MNSDFRCHVFSLSLLIGLAAPWAATAQVPISHVGSGSLEERVTLLERISNAQGQLLNQLQQQLSENQHDIDALRGQTQENQYQLNQVERQRKSYQQMDNLSQGSAQVGGVTAGAAVAGTSNGSTRTSVVPSNQGDENSDYNTAVSLALEKKQYDPAISAFQSFVKQHPKSTYQPNANYWLGQLLYNKGKKDDAAYYFAVVVKNYVKSPKAPDAMYKVGIIMQEKGQADKANAVFQQVIKQYPTSAAAALAKSRVAG